MLWVIFWLMLLLQQAKSEGIEYRSKYIESVKPGLKLFSRYWAPKHTHSLRGLVFLSHGHGEHLGGPNGYIQLANLLASHGFLVFGHDHLGHGRSDGKRVYIESIDEFVDDVFKHCYAIRKRHQGLPLFLYGHSMGGMIAIKSVLRKPRFFQGLVLEDALIIAPREQTTPFAELLVNVISAVLPEYQLGEEISETQLTRERKVQVQIRDDMLRWKEAFKVIMLRAWIRCLEYNIQRLYKVDLPLLILYGEDDELTEFDGSDLLYKESRSVDKSLRVYPGAKHHLIIEEPRTRHAALKEIVGWLKYRSP